MHEIEVIAKSGHKVYKIVNITRNEYDSMQKKKGFSYQTFQVGFSKYYKPIIKDYQLEKEKLKSKL